MQITDIEMTKEGMLLLVAIAKIKSFDRSKTQEEILEDLIQRSVKVSKEITEIPNA